MKPIYIFAGGTGGHIYPALAFAQAWKSEMKDAKVVWFGRPNSLEQEVCQLNGIDFTAISSSGIYNHNLIYQIKSAWVLLTAVVSVFLLMVWKRPSAIIGFGSYASLPGLVSGFVLRVPRFAHEQNTHAGAASLLAEKLKAYLFAGMPVRTPKGAWSSSVLVGNPVRQSIIQASQHKDLTKNRQDEQSDKKKWNILVLGGSQGAERINKMVDLCLVDSPTHWNWCVIAGPGKVDQLLHANQSKAQVEVIEFTQEIEQKLQWADICICRSGALTIAELSLMSLPAIFIPLSTSAHNHQFENAQELTKLGAGKLLDERTSTHIDLMKQLQELTKQTPEKWQEMQTAITALAKDDAAEQIVSVMKKELA